MCTYNGERFLEEQLSSFVQQIVLPDELIVSDDLSTDRTWQILSDFASSAPFPVKLKRNERNIGVTKNFESALGLAKGDVIFMCDQDDVWRNDKILLTLKIFESAPDVGMVFTDAEIVDDQLNDLGDTLWQYWKITQAEQNHFDEDPFDFLLTNRNIVTGAAAAFSRDAVTAALPFPESMPILHDAWLALIASYFTKVYADPQRLLKYRQHSSQLTGVRQARPDIGKKHYEAHLAQLSALAERISSITVSDNNQRLTRVKDYANHLSTRLNLPPSLPGRLLSVVHEVFSGRYTKYSSGLRSAAKDLLQRG